MKLHELARELDVHPKELQNFLQQNRMLSRNPAAQLTPRAIDAAKNQFARAGTVATRVAPGGDHKVALPEHISVRELAERLGVAPPDVQKKLMQSNVMATLNQVLDYATAEIIADDYGFTVEPVSSEDLITVETDGDRVVEKTRAEIFSNASEDPDKLQARPPIVTVLGHVDHGKTSILDALRSTKVAAGEAGGITQRIGAYKVTTADGEPVVFIDTPGHEAFTAMRARGASVTDVAVLVVAADDGVMPQTVEAIQHARAAEVPIVVAINKIDKDNANVDRVHAELAENEVVTRHFGGEYECVHVSARTGEGLQDLLETIVLSSQILDLKANPDRAAIGTVVDAHMERGRGPVATVLVQQGTLRVGDNIVLGHIHGRVRALADDRGEAVTEAPPATPVVVSGFDEVPVAGDILQVVGSEKAARAIALEKLQDKRAAEAAQASGVGIRLTLEEIGKRAAAGEAKELNLVVKADMQGTLEAVLAALGKIEDPVVTVKTVRSGVGPVTDADVMLASVASAIIVGFNLKPTTAAERAAEKAKVEIRYYDVIYKLTEDVERAAKGMREPTYRQVEEGRVDVVMPIKIPRLGIIAGSRVIDGKVSRGGYAKLYRGGSLVWEGRIASLKHFKEDVREMVAGQECGIGLEGYEDIQGGETMETFRLEREEI